VLLGACISPLGYPQPARNEKALLYVPCVCVYGGGHFSSLEYCGCTTAKENRRLTAAAAFLGRFLPCAPNGGFLYSLLAAVTAGDPQGKKNRRVALFKITLPW
jgi:hypothetical protein